MVRKILPLLLVLTGLMLAGCGDYGKVEQGRTVAFDKDKGQVTIIVDNNLDPKKQPNYATLPVHVYTLPTVPAERGADPTPALRMGFDVEKKIITMYNPKTKAFEELPFEVLADHKDVNVRRQHPLVWDAATRRAISFPRIDAANRTIDIYSRRQLRFTSIKLSEADFAKYKDKEWDAGDEVRIYYKEPGKAQRFMNITKTDITRR
ncbi:MAG: DUF4881 domain-containing protein [Deltaproteobacteria bacterium]|jgi:hypothetical protein|nr:DUF4881 domain-containing protein [Deltaproteobacteria bacterium]